MIITNDKRREVAAKVRETMGALGQVELDGIPLADLIEPEDSWERLEEDARQLDIDLNDTTDDYPRMSCCRDLVRRARMLAERGE